MVGLVNKFDKWCLLLNSGMNTDRGEVLLLFELLDSKLRIPVVNRSILIQFITSKFHFMRLQGLRD